MTETLKTLLDQASDRDFATVDLAAITAKGDRTVRGRRRRWAAAGVAAIALAVGTAALVAGDDEDHVTELPDSVPAGATWVVGQTLHTPTASYDLGHRVRTYVRTTVGLAILTPDGEVYSYVDGQMLLIGEGAVGEPVLLSDTEDSWVGWIDRSGATPAFVAHDLATGRSVREDVQSDAPDSDDDLDLIWYIGIDDGTAYWIDRRGTVAMDLEQVGLRVLSLPGEAPWISHVENGMLVRLVETASGGDLGSEVVDIDGTAVLPYEKGRYLGIISPDGRWITGDGLEVVELSTGESYAPTPGVVDGGAYEWLDADTVAVLREELDTVDLLTCEVPAGTCTVVAEDVVSSGQELVIPGSSGLFG